MSPDGKRSTTNEPNGAEIQPHYAKLPQNAQGGFQFCGKIMTVLTFIDNSNPSSIINDE
jgi:hypothetical protein